MVSMKLFNETAEFFMHILVRVHELVLICINENKGQNQCMYPYGMCTKNSAVSLKSFMLTMDKQENTTKWIFITFIMFIDLIE